MVCRLWARWLGVTACAFITRLNRSGMRRVAIRAALTSLMARVRQHPLGVTARALFRRHGRRLVKMMTVPAIRRRVSRDRRRMRFRIRMTRDARRDLLLGARECMTRRALGLHRDITRMRVR
jgi:hypothetical protein